MMWCRQCFKAVRTWRDVCTQAGNLGTGFNESTVVLGIESSFDDTAVGIVQGNGKILGEAVHSQLSAHKATGGVVPMVAGELHKNNINGVTHSALERAGLKMDGVAAVAVTIGPGLAPCLKEGLAYAKALAQSANKPLIPVHHMEAHALTPRMEEEIPFPYLVLLATGGHCILGIVHTPGKFSRLGNTTDDSPGEAFDKVARMLRLHRHPKVSHLSGGAAIEVLARHGNPKLYHLPHVMSRRMCCQFSFSGLKTAVKNITLRIQADNPDAANSLEPLPGCEHIAAAFQEAVCRHLLTKTHRAVLFCQQQYPQINHLVLSGGVASNNHLRLQMKELAALHRYTLHTPPPRLCTDNGVMIAWTALEYMKAGVDAAVKDMLTLDFMPRWPLGEDISHRVEMAQLKIPR
ncbi:hypothetical protein EMCRGX_G012449 [Ephydatia muelleri]